MRLYIFLVEGFFRSAHVLYSDHGVSWTETLSSAHSEGAKKRFSRLLLILLDASHEAAEASGFSILNFVGGTSMWRALCTTVNPNISASVTMRKHGRR